MDASSINEAQSRKITINNGTVNPAENRPEPVEKRIRQPPPRGGVGFKACKSIHVSPASWVSLSVTDAIRLRE